MVKKLTIGFDAQELVEQFSQRGYNRAEVTERVAEILQGVRTRGDQALCEYTRAFDAVELRPEQLKVSQEEMEAASRVIDHELLSAIELAADRIRRFHEAQRQKSWRLEEPGEMLGQQVRPIEHVGVYAPGGTAVLFSTALMNIIPAQVASCRRIAVTSPPQRTRGGALSPTILAVLHLLGVNEAYRIGGAQAIAALAFGTETIPAVDMICGPGNIYVNEAKRQIQGKVRIDCLAGETEVLIIADETASPRHVAADLLAQLEHDVAAAAMLLTPQADLIGQVEAELQVQSRCLSRKEILERSMENNCYLVQTRNLQEAFDVANRIAPEHLELLIADAQNQVRNVHHAGAIFIGTFAPEAMGDYIAGPNHVLPTGRTARFSSGLSVDDFVKKSSLIYFDSRGFGSLAEAAMLLAQAEGLDGHVNSIRVRL